MSSLSSSGAAETCGANSISNDQELSVFFDNDDNVKSVETRELCAALEQHLKAINNYQSLIHQALCRYEQHGDASFEGVECVFKELMMMRKTLQSLVSSFDKKLDCINTRKKVSAVFFTAAAAITAAVAAANANTKKTAAAAAAAAASILFVAVGKWIHSLLRKRESAVKKPKEIIRVMIMGAKISIKDVTDIHVLARRLQFQTSEMAESDDDVDVMEKVAAVKKSFEELRGKANDYNRNMNWAIEVVLQCIITLTHME